MDVPDQPEVIYVLKRFTVRFTQDDVDSWVADVFDGDNYIYSDRGETRDDARREVVAWVYENYDVPKSIETIELHFHEWEDIDIEYHQPEELYERKDIRK